MSYEKFYPNGWQSGEAGGTPITPESLEHIENGIANALPKDGSDPMTADLPMAGHKVTDLGVPTEDGDAVPLGYANQNFAPAGYGLGGACVDVDSWDNATENGWYRSAGNAAISGRMYGYVTKHTDAWIIQEAYQFDETTNLTYKAIRAKMAGVWQPWEWLNPPMVLGVEYRTTERWNGAAVYCMAVEFGSLPNATYKAITLSTTISRCIRYNLVNKYSSLMLTGNRNISEIYFDESALQISTSADMSAHRAICAFWYIKD